MSSEYKSLERNMLPISAQKPGHHVIVMIPTTNELQGILPELRKLLNDQGFEEGPRRSGPGIIFTKEKESGLIFRVLVFCDNLKGNVLTAAHTAHLCGSLQPELIISAGIAGSFNPAAAWIGDVILPFKVENSTFDKVYQSSTTDTDSMPVIVSSLGKKASFRSPIRLAEKKAEFWTGGAGLIGQIKSEKVLDAIAYPPHDSHESERRKIFDGLSTWLSQEYGISATAPTHPRFHAGATTFSWDKVFDSRNLYQYLLSTKHLSRDAMCVEMESFGFAIAVQVSQEVRYVDALIVRGISDIVGCKGYTDDKTHNLEGFCRQLAMSNVAKTVSYVVSERFGLK